ncbi:hypothetical protein LCGC14_0595760 [marine sediment metagenome]|uniref:Uncharacterized protein n=1 Tax=marine sediment metagenome TaxID=412755 RepID=A0A0F9RVS7_9ZZZZ
MKDRFHWKIKEENKGLLKKIMKMINNALKNENYVNAKVSNKRMIDPPDTPINLITTGFIKDNVQYRISVEIMD